MDVDVGVGVGMGVGWTFGGSVLGGSGVGVGCGFICLAIASRSLVLFGSQLSLDAACAIRGWYVIFSGISIIVAETMAFASIFFILPPIMVMGIKKNGAMSRRRYGLDI